jgi:very-short-patch-repair endonuclease
MRAQILKNKRGISTKNERRFMELLKINHIPFKTKQKIGGREVDFLIGKYAIDIDGHGQDSEKNVYLHENGYIPIHYENMEISRLTPEKLKNVFNQLH